MSETTEIELSELKRAAGELVSYLNSTEKNLEIVVQRNGISRALFNEKEIIHLKDVKNLIQLNQRIQFGSFLFFVIYVLISVIFAKGKYLVNLYKLLFYGSLSTIGIIMLLLVLGLLLGFDNLFTQFHLLSFSNTLWILDPSQDYLIMMFPEQFFYDAALFGGLATLSIAVIIGSATGLLYFREKRLMAGRARG